MLCWQMVKQGMQEAVVVEQVEQVEQVEVEVVEVVEEVIEAKQEQMRVQKNKQRFD